MKYCISLPLTCLQWWHADHRICVFIRSSMHWNIQSWTNDLHFESDKTWCNISSSNSDVVVTLLQSPHMSRLSPLLFSIHLWYHVSPYICQCNHICGIVSLLRLRGIVILCSLFREKHITHLEIYFTHITQYWWCDYQKKNQFVCNY